METWTMEKAKRARKAETPKRPSLCLRLRAPYLYPDPTATIADASLLRCCKPMQRALITGSLDHKEGSNETARVVHTYRKRSDRSTARCTRAAAGSAGDWVPGSQIARRNPQASARISRGPEGDRSRRGR